MRVILVAPLLALVGGAALAQTTPTRNPAEVLPGAYMVEPQHTQVYWSLAHLGFTTFYGRLSEVAGSLTLAPNSPAADQLAITMPTDSLNTTSDKLNQELQGSDWFDAKSYPTIAFKSTKVDIVGRGHATVTGALTLHGFTRPLVLDVHFNAAGVNPIDHHYTVGFQATGIIKRSQFGVTKYVPVVGDDVSLMISAAFVQAPAQ